MSLKIENVAVSALVPYQRNARTHSHDQVAIIASSIEEFGFTNPILVSADMEVIAGHGRLAAAKHLRLVEVPVIRLGHLSEAQRRALVIADNRIAELAGWDEDLLQSEIEALAATELPLEVLGFSQAELDEILDDVEESLAEASFDPEAVPPLETSAVTSAGDVWILGRHRLICGSATEKATADLLLAGELADCVWTDPPYNVDYEGAAGKIANDNMGASEFRSFLDAAFAVMFSAMKPGAPIYVAHADTEGLAFRGAFAEAGFKLSGCLVWVKPSLVLGRSDYQWRHEPILYGWKPGAAHFWKGGRAHTTVEESGSAGVRVMPDRSVQVDVGDRTLIVRGSDLELSMLDGSVIRVDKPRANSVHPTMKPVELICRQLGNSSPRGAVVMDPFGGSGSTLMACEITGRSARLSELDPRFCDVIVKRWQEASGGEARHEATGQTFAERCASVLDLAEAS